MASGVYSLVVVCGLLVVVASRVVEHRLWSTGSVVLANGLFLQGIWDLPGPGIEPMSLALAGGFLTIAPPEKSPEGQIFNIQQSVKIFC